MGVCSGFPRYGRTQKTSGTSLHASTVSCGMPAANLDGLLVRRIQSCESIVTVPYLCRCCTEARGELASQLCAEWEQLEAMMQEMYSMKDAEVVRDIFSGRRVIGCTTSGAAKFKYVHPLLVAASVRFVATQYRGDMIQRNLVAAVSKAVALRLMGALGAHVHVQSPLSRVQD